ncbi:hypothetical protein L1987_17692 [Smallanthus sonchifolius]|uniref:Uncharacterized protein n=1 Tax=Smallanthus sonchifolius TaxID=185202 RepID=A0ACB9IXI8_9ASTR|nr:hypothetical protein L1987_17692 [Smallanthus sonchifolius]
MLLNLHNRRNTAFEASKNHELDQSIPHFNLKLQILCRVNHTQLLISWHVVQQEWGPVAPTPLPEPRNREWIWITHSQFSNQKKATRTIGEILQAMWSHPWQSWRDVSKEDGDRMFERFNGYYQWESKHTLGSQTYVTSKLKLDKELGRPATVDEIWMQSHGKKGTRPLDRLLRCRGGEGLEAGGLEEIDLQNHVEWVDSRAEESFKSYQESIKEKYGDDNGKHPLFDEDSWIEAFGGKKKEMKRFNG